MSIMRRRSGHDLVVPDLPPLGLAQSWLELGNAERALGGLGRGRPQVSEAVERSHDRSEPVPLTQLVSEQLEFVWRLSRRLGLSPARADDLTQEVFLVAMRREREIRPGRERAFLYGVVLRLVANARRQERRRREVPEPHEPSAPGPLPDESLDRERAAARLDLVLETLPEKLRRVLVLSDVLELEVGEVAELERIPRGTVASRLKRARELFKKKVMGQGPGSSAKEYLR